MIVASATDHSIVLYIFNSLIKVTLQFYAIAADDLGTGKGR